jgi:hypothetical protein
MQVGEMEKRDELPLGKIDKYLGTLITCDEKEKKYNHERRSNSVSNTRLPQLPQVS